MESNKMDSTRAQNGPGKILLSPLSVVRETYNAALKAVSYYDHF
jgi:hypothetical protein